MKTKTAIAKAGSAAALGRIFGISQQAVSKWPDQVPPLRLFQLREAKPEWFQKKGPK